MADQEEALYLNPPRIATAGRKLEEMAKMANIMESQGVNNDHMKQMVSKISFIVLLFSSILRLLNITIPLFPFKLNSGPDNRIYWELYE